MMEMDRKHDAVENHRKSSRMPVMLVENHGVLVNRENKNRWVRYKGERGLQRAPQKHYKGIVKASEGAGRALARKKLGLSQGWPHRELGGLQRELGGLEIKIL